MWLCLVPAGALPKIHIPDFDKIVHFTFYFILAAAMKYGWKRQTALEWLQRNTFLKVFMVAALYGLTIEIMQETLTTTRHFEWLDEAANCVGALTGLAISSLVEF